MSTLPDNIQKELYPPINPFSTGYLTTDISNDNISAVDIYFEECGNPDGIPILFLHGGPGANCIDDYRRFFDPKKYRVILFDQPGCGKSRPSADDPTVSSTLYNNLTHKNLIDCINKLLDHLSVTKCPIFGGSWGSTLALYYAQAMPSRVTHLILRGIFLNSPHEMDALYTEGPIVDSFGENGRQALEVLTNHLKDNGFNASSTLELLQSYRELCNTSDNKLSQYLWSVFEEFTDTGSDEDLLRLKNAVDIIKDKPLDATLRSTAILQLAIFIWGYEMPELDILAADNIQRITNAKIPVYITQGADDTTTPPLYAELLQKAILTTADGTYESVDCKFIPGGKHSPFSHPGMTANLVKTCDDLIFSQRPESTSHTTEPVLTEYISKRPDTSGVAIESDKNTSDLRIK